MQNGSIALPLYASVSLSRKWVSLHCVPVGVLEGFGKMEEASGPQWALPLLPLPRGPAAHASALSRKAHGEQSRLMKQVSAAHLVNGIWLER